MPKSPKKPCRYPNCPKLTNKSYCPEHERTMNRRYEKYGRNRESRKRYDGRWRKIRDAYAAAHPLCEECLKKERYVRTQHIHHIKPLSEGGTNDFSNLMALCKSCHSRLHGEHGDRWHNMGEDKADGK